MDSPMGRTRSPARIVFVAWNVALAAWAVLAAVRGEFGVVLLAELALAWFAVATVGVVFPALEMYGPIVQRGPTGRRTVALTFDDGPHPETTRRILAALAGTRHRATFFVLGAKARRHPDVLREIQAGGHTIGIHGDEHDRLHSFRMPWRVYRDLVRAAAAVEDATGVRPRLFRPPLGHTSANAAPGVRRAGMLVIGWSTRGLDGMRTQTPDGVVARIAGSLTDGDIVMLHDAAERDDYEPASVRALPAVLRLLDERGWTSVGVDALIDVPASSPTPATVPMAPAATTPGGRS
jgi:peptidoglycan-N-acetylglucosamine deacetylase